MHVDMDAFYASVELVSNPALQDVPMFVGGTGRGVVLSANYLAREFGISSGMPTMRARRLCPQVVVIPPDMDRYARVSDALSRILGALSAQVEKTSIDEAYVDLTGTLRRLGATPAEVAGRLQAQIADEQQLSCSVGIGPSRLVAKLGSKLAKPGGCRIVAPGEVIAFLHPLPVDIIPGVGSVTAEKLHRLGLGLVGEVANTPRRVLQRAFGQTRGALLFDLAWGKDERPIASSIPAEHTVGAQETFGEDTDDAETIRTEILRMAERATARMRAQRVLGRAVTLSIRFADMTTITRSGTLPAPTDLTGDIHAEAVRLFSRLNLQRARIRRVGVRVGGLVDREKTYLQPALGDSEYGWPQAEEAMDDLVRRFGPKALRRAKLARGLR